MLAQPSLTSIHIDPGRGPAAPPRAQACGRRGLEVSAAAMILVHNHPSGDPTPSRADIDITRQIIQAAKALSVEVHDHLIVGREGVTSFKQLGLM